MSSELLLTLVVALLVLGPKKLALIAEKLGPLIHRFNNYWQKGISYYENQLGSEILHRNIKKAEAADLFYQEKKDREHTTNNIPSS